MVRPGPDSASMNGPLALEVLTNTTRRGASFFSKRLEVAGGHVGPGQVELGGLAVEAAVADQHHENRILGPRRGELLERLGDLLAGGLAGDPLAVGLWLLVQVGDLLLRNPIARRRRVDQRRAPLAVGLGELRIAGQPDDHQQMRRLGRRNRGRHERQQQGSQVASNGEHRASFLRRNAVNTANAVNVDPFAAWTRWRAFPYANPTARR